MPNTTQSCASCKKTSAEVDNLKRCAKCQTTYYCSRNCQKADWKVHKKICSAQASQGPAGPSLSSASSSASGPNGSSGNIKNLEGNLTKPFTKLDKGTYLHDLPEKDVYKLLIDAFRLRLEDNYKFEGDAEEDSIYDGSPDSLRPFTRFLRLAAAKPGFLPLWWDASKQAECEKLGMMEGGWSDLSCAVEKSDINEHYGTPDMAMQLRMLYAEIYGRGPMGQDSTGMRQFKMAMESRGAPGYQTPFDMSALFGR